MNILDEFTRNIMPKDLWQLIGNYLNFYDEIQDFRDLIPGLNFILKPRLETNITYQTGDTGESIILQKQIRLDQILIREESYYPDGKISSLKLINPKYEIEREWSINRQLDHFRLKYGDIKEAIDYYRDGTVMNHKIEYKDFEIEYDYTRNYNLENITETYLNQTHIYHYNQYFEHETTMVETKNDLRDHVRSYAGIFPVGEVITDHKTKTTIYWTFSPKTQIEKMSLTNVIYSYNRKKKTLTKVCEIDTKDREDKLTSTTEKMWSIPQNVIFGSDLTKVEPGKLLHHINRTQKRNLHGPCIWYHPNGQLKRSVEYYNGTIVGRDENYDEDGLMIVIKKKFTD